jgi:hypothetical protein
MIRALCLSAIFATPAAANIQCGTRDAVLRHLAQKYHEGVIGRGIANGGDTEHRHYPLGNRILRRNQTPGPVPPLWFIVIFLGTGVGAMLTLGYAGSKVIDFFAKQDGEQNDTTARH